MRTLVISYLVLVSSFIGMSAGASGGVPGTTDCRFPKDGHCLLSVSDWRFTIKLENVGKKICGVEIVPESGLLPENAVVWPHSVFAWAIGGNILTHGPNLLETRANFKSYTLRVQPEAGRKVVFVTLGEGSDSTWPEFIQRTFGGGGIDVWPLACDANHRDSETAGSIR